MATPSPVGKRFAGILAASRAGGDRGPLAGGAVTAPPIRTAPSTEGLRDRGPGLEGVEGVEGQRGSRSGGQDKGGEGDGADHEARDLDLLDPAARHAASLAPPVTTAPSSPSPAHATEAPLRARSLEELLPALVRRIAWAGDKHKGTVRLELGAGAYAGTTVIVHAEEGRVRVEISGREGPELDRLRARLDGRLRRHGLDVESVS